MPKREKKRKQRTRNFDWRRRPLRLPFSYIKQNTAPFTLRSARLRLEKLEILTLIGASGVVFFKQIKIPRLSLELHAPLLSTST